MATKRQKKVERKRKKRSEKRRGLQRQRSQGLAVRMKQAAAAPLHQCLMTVDLATEGIGQVIFSRRLPDRQIATAFFLVDVYCLGVKDAYGRFLTEAEFEEIKSKLEDSQFDLEPIDAPSARRLVEQAVAYAEDLGLSPRGDYRKVVPIFGDVDPDEGDDLREFGRDGKPFFVCGPHDTPEQCRRIMNTLNRTCGPDGFHYVIPVGGPNLLDGTPVVPIDDDGTDFLEHDEFLEDDEFE